MVVAILVSLHCYITCCLKNSWVKCVSRVHNDHKLFRVVGLLQDKYKMQHHKIWMIKINFKNSVNERNYLGVYKIDIPAQKAGIYLSYKHLNNLEGCAM